MFALIRLLRPHQWIKNSFVFAGIIFAHLQHNAVLVKQAGILAVAFCLVSSAAYIVNDIFDRANDAAHPLKKLRPLAAGTISVTTALITALILTIASFSLAMLTTHTAVAILFCYLLLSIAYSAWLKNWLYLDILVIASGFLLRILAGTIGIGITPSNWILVCSLCLTLFLGFNKRRAEQRLLQQAELPLPPILQRYQPRLLDTLIWLTALATILSYIFYTAHQFHAINFHPSFIFSIPLVAFGIIRYLYLSKQNLVSYHGIDMARDILQDPYLLTSLAVWVIIAMNFNG